MIQPGFSCDDIGHVSQNIGPMQARRKLGRLACGAKGATRPTRGESVQAVVKFVDETFEIVDPHGTTGKAEMSFGLNIAERA